MLEVLDVRAEPLDVALVEPFGIATGAQLVAANVRVEVELTDGTIGLGEAAPFPAVSGETQAGALASVARARAALLGQDPGRWRHAARLLAELMPDQPSARCALEGALLDALCKASGLSLWRFFGGAEQGLETDITLTTGDVEAARRAAARAAADGFSSLKVKVGGAPLDHDVARLRAAADAAPGARLLLDANAALTADDALGLLDALGPLRARLALFEQPTPAEDLDALARVRERAGVPIAADESARSAADVARLAACGAVDVINVKLMKTGVAEALDMIAAARAHGLGLMIGGMVETSLAMGISACLAAGLGGFSFVDLDTPLFMRDAPTRGGPLREGPRITLGGVTRGHGVTLEPRRVV
ncbi:MAG: dipeptide epimerase [Polyangiaceae bacterium]|nr:dipeptide epimerase [Polyangiaceae bacterium]